jgi:hypothetical protein
MPQVSWNGITVNMVTVTGKAVTMAYQAGPPSGTLYFAPTDICWSVTNLLFGNLPTVGVELDATGSFSTQLFAMDNAGISSNWSWSVSGTLNGIVFASRKINVLYANGDTQTMEFLLSSSQLMP